MRLRIRNRNDVMSNYQTGVKWMLATLVQCQNNLYKVGTHASFYFQLIISQTIKLTKRVTHTIKWFEIKLSPHIIELSFKNIPYCKTTCQSQYQSDFLFIVSYSFRFLIFLRNSWCVC